jgi:hypothetical protein
MAKYKKYILFAYDQYYPLGGLEDVRGEADTMEELQPEIDKNSRSQTWYVIDRDTWETVASNSTEAARAAYAAKTGR